ncbi:MAG: SPFH domain-containing protein [Planctomycetota bacterium]|nr:SPFH domain-containing protein [Planctomycetota bacterium]MDA1104984.1 SPFH domain-containing protein [Planctomycetota bacterium]
MRTDHLAYQQATRVAFLGLLLQLGLGLVLLAYGRGADDSALGVTSQWILVGVIPWIALVLTFQQHTSERLESLELDAGGEGAGSAFDATDSGARVAARRLKTVHAWLVPGASILYAGILVWVGWSVYAWFRALAIDDPNAVVAHFGVNPNSGWELALCAGGALVVFIFSRFVAGMARQPAWSNLRGGAGIMVGNAIVLLAVATGTIFQLFAKPAVLEGVTQGIGWFMWLIAAETALNLVLHIYRPRRPGEIPKAAFDSKLLGLLATPDSLVRSINEAVNYQFGFDLTSSWGYQLLLRSLTALAGVGIIVLLAMSCVVVVGPGEQAIRLRGDRIVGEVATGTVLFKLPWPLEDVEVWPVGRVHTVLLGPPTRNEGEVILWVDDENSLEAGTDRAPYLVLAGRAAQAVASSGRPGAEDTDETSAQGFSLVDADIQVNWRIRPDGLLDFIGFSNDTRSRRSRLDMRERALQQIALREATQFLSTQTLESVLSPQGDSLTRALQSRIQGAFDAAGSGVEVVSVLVPRLRPPNGARNAFEELSIDQQNVQKMTEEARRVASVTMAAVVGGEALAQEAIAAIAELRRIESAHGVSSREAAIQRATLEALLVRESAQAATVISRARARRWEVLMDARSNAADVLGQAPAFEAAPELYRQRRMMEVLAAQLARVRIKYLIGTDPAGTTLDIEMQEAESGLNLADYLSKDGGGGGG